jgi:hypothetical protein
LQEVLTFHACASDGLQRSLYHDLHLQNADRSGTIHAPAEFASPSIFCGCTPYQAHSRGIWSFLSLSLLSSTCTAPTILSPSDHPALSPARPPSSPPCLLVEEGCRRGRISLSSQPRADLRLFPWRRAGCRINYARYHPGTIGLGGVEVVVARADADAPVDGALPLLLRAEALDERALPLSSSDAATTVPEGGEEGVVASHGVISEEDASESTVGKHRARKLCGSRRRNKRGQISIGAEAGASLTAFVPAVTLFLLAPGRVELQRSLQAARVGESCPCGRPRRGTAASHPREQPRREPRSPLVCVLEEARLRHSSHRRPHQGRLCGRRLPSCTGANR